MKIYIGDFGSKERYTRECFFFNNKGRLAQSPPIWAREETYTNGIFNYTLSVEYNVSKYRNRIKIYK